MEHSFDANKQQQKMCIPCSFGVKMYYFTIPQRKYNLSISWRYLNRAKQKTNGSANRDA